MATSLFSTTPTYPATFTQPLGENIADYLASELRRPTDIAGLMPQVAGVDPFTQAAQQRTATQSGLGAVQYDPQGRITGIGQGTGIAGYEPYLQGAAQLAGPQGYQQYMSPYQQDIINTTLSEYDVQAQKGLNPLSANAINAGAFGGAREGIQRAEYQSASDRNRAALQAQLLGQGFTQAQQLANQGYGQQLGLASLQPQLAASGISQLGNMGTQSQQYAQNILNAIQQGNLMQDQYGLQRLGGITNLFGNLAQSTPGEPGTPVLTNPALTAAQAFGSIYGPLAGVNQRTTTGTTGGTGGGGSSGGGILDTIGQAANVGSNLWNLGSSIWGKIF
jgi:hypothetical protein